MPVIDRQRVAGYFTRGDEADTPNEKGAALEDLIAYLFALIPGVELTTRNKLNAFGTQEIDVAFWNNGSHDGLRLFDFLLLVECKNWSEPAGFAELDLFKSKLQSRGRPMGIFIAASGITGTPTDRNRAHEVLSSALREGREMLVITRSEIETLTNTSDLVDLLKRKRAQLAVSGTIFEST